MTTDINEIYKKYPCAEEAAKENIRFWDSEESLNESNMTGVLESALKIESSDEELYKFFETIIHHDAFLLKENEISLEEEKKRNKVIEDLTEKHLGFWHSALYNSPKTDNPITNPYEFLNEETYWKIFCEDNL